MPGNKKIKSVLVWLLMAAFCGLTGFAIVYYYATHERPLEQFAIVVDAGSTQTRSSLYRISVHTPEPADWRQNEHELEIPLSEVLQVRQVSSCVNGGPLAAISSPLEARKLIENCLVKFANHIKLLDFVDLNQLADSDSSSFDADEVSRQLSMTDHRVNSVTHLHVGATAGMRALEELNRTRAQEKLAWMDEAVRASNELLPPDVGANPYVNRGFVGIIEGAQEASFGWVSVNFVCDSLAVHAPPVQAIIDRQQSTNSSTIYQFNNEPSLPPAPNTLHMPHSIGTLELGGASAQMALQVPADNRLSAALTRNMSLEEQELNLFNGQYKLATRSDLCLGMSQAVLRLNYLLIRQVLTTTTTTSSLEIINPCLQRGARIKFSGSELANIWRGACLVGPQAELVRMNVINMKLIELVGTGEVDKCDVLLNQLIEPTECKKHFSLCPDSENNAPPPQDMPFVTISGYNHALNVLGLTPKPADNKWQQQLIETIDNKLGGNSIDYLELELKTREFCATNASILRAKYPKVSEKFKHIICLQLVYIKKLLVEFYQFSPTTTSWSQIKFLVFTPKSVPNQFAPVQKATNPNNKLDVRRDIGWTLGLLLNATSQQLSGGASDDLNNQTIYFHHGASVMFIIRATIMLMLACCLVAVGLLVIGVVQVKQAQGRAEAYEINTSSSSQSSSSYDICDLTSHVISIDTSNNKTKSQRYVLAP